MFLTKNKFLTHYALSCGYIELSEPDAENLQLRMYSQHGVIHVEYDCFWKSFNNITEARKCFMEQLRSSKLKRVIPC